MWLSLMKPITLRPVSSLDLVAEVGLHDALPASAQVEHGLALAGVGQRLLAAREAVLEHDEDAVVAERGSCLGRAAAGRARERPDHGVRDRRRELPVGQAVLVVHRRPRCRARRSWRDPPRDRRAPDDLAPRPFGRVLLGSGSVHHWADGNASATAGGERRRQLPHLARSSPPPESTGAAPVQPRRVVIAAAMLASLSELYQTGVKP